MKRIALRVACVLGILALVLSTAGCAVNTLQDAQPQAQSAATWTQSTVADFKRGTLQRVQIERQGDGELTLARNAQGQYEAAGVYTSPVFAPSGVFSMAVWRWEAEIPVGTGLTLSVRTSDDGKTWGEWQELAPDEDLKSATDDWPGHMWYTQGARFIQYRLQFASADGQATPVVSAVTWTFANTQPGPTVQEAMQMVIPQGEGPGVQRPAIIPRRGWGADESLMTWEPKYEKPVKIIIHHTATPNDPKQDPAATVRAVYYYHAVTRGWGDIGYNYLIDRLGNIYEGRKGGEGVVGGHDYGFNEGSVGISLIGDFQSEPPTDAMMDALARLVAWVCDRYGIDPTGRSIFRDLDLPNIAGHRETKSTTCPGDQVQNRLPALRERVAEIIHRQAPSVRFVAPTADRPLSGAQTIQVQGGVATSDITLYLDGKPVHRKIGTALEYKWDTTAVADGDHLLKAVAHNARGEEAVQSLMVLVDNTPPQVTLLINNGARYATQQTITLTVEALDVGSGVDAMQMSPGEDPTGAPSQPYTHELTLELGEQPGPRTYSVRVMDKAGLASGVSVAQVFYDPNPPGGWTDAALSSTGEVAVRVRDDESGLEPASAFAAWSADGGVTWSVWQDAIVTPDGAEATLYARIPAEATLVRFRISDVAGNLAESPVYPLPCEACPPKPTPEPQPEPTPEPAPTAPDVIVAGMDIFPPQPDAGEPVLFRVRVRNQGDGPAPGFWVQLYIDPKTVPYVNSIASLLGTGILWYVPDLAPGEEVTLLSSNPYPEYGNFAGSLASGMHSIYVLADAYHTEGQTGLVTESDEQNNLFGPVQLEVKGSKPFNWSSLEEWLSRWLNWKP